MASLQPFRHLRARIQEARKARGEPLLVLAGAVFIYDMLWLAALGTVAGLYAVGVIPPVSTHNTVTSLLPVSVPWFGALGSILISLYGVFFHRKDWEAGWAYWHYGRPLVGASFAVVAGLIFLGVLRATVEKSTNLTAASDVYVLNALGFLVGYREQSFRELLKRFTDLILAPGGSAAAGTAAAPPRPHMTISPKSGTPLHTVEITLEELSGQAAVTTYTLDFGDGTKQGGTSLPSAPISHTYPAARTYRVTLTEDSGGFRTPVPDESVHPFRAISYTPAGGS